MWTSFIADTPEVGKPFVALWLDGAGSHVFTRINNDTVEDVDGLQHEIEDLFKIGFLEWMYIPACGGFTSEKKTIRINIPYTWKPFSCISPDIGRSFVALRKDGKGCKTYKHVKEGIIWTPSGEKGEYELSEIVDEYPLWAYLPEDYKLWFEVEHGGE